MNVPNSIDDETTTPEFQRGRSYLTVDGQAWDVSNLLDSLPPFPDNERGDMYSREYTYLKHDIVDEKQTLQRTPSVKKTTNPETSLRLRPVPVYEWRSTSSLQKQEPQIHHDNDGENIVEDDDDDDGVSVVLDGPSAEPDSVNPSDDFERSIIEIFPGVEMPLRGSLETQQAISRNYVTGVNCMDCTLRLKCIRNAEYVLCPLCHCVSPLELSCSTLEVGSFGVGLGFVDSVVAD